MYLNWPFVWVTALIFSAEDTIKILSNIAAHLKPGGHLLINSWSLAEIAFKSFKEKAGARWVS